MDKAKLDKANEIDTQIDYYDGMISDLELADSIEFIVREEGVPRRLLTLWENWGNNSDLFDVVIGSILTELRSRKVRLENEFEKL